MAQHNQYSRLLDLILALTRVKGATAEELEGVLGTTRRNLYYCFTALRDYGFTLVRRGKRYHLDPQSPFFQRITTSINFSETEAVYLYKLVSAGEKNQTTGMIRRKLEQFYDLNIFSDKDMQSRMAENVARLYEAIDKKKVVMLKNYSSPHSGTVGNRLVEPYLFLNGDIDVQCYEISSGKNKTFKVSRMEEVVVSNDLDWSHEYMHKEAFTDLFMFTGDTRHHVRLRLGLLSYNLMREEHPMSYRCMTKEDATHWIFEADVVSYVGIGRFILGLAGDIAVLGDDGLRAHLRAEVARMRF